VAALLAAAAAPAAAITIELKDVAPDRIERQRANAEGRLPLANTPDVARLEQRLKAAGFKSGAPMLMRIFKETSELEIWLEKGDRFQLFATYPICYWSGTLGPKLREGDRQTPEGFYTITGRELHHGDRWRRSLNVGYPNLFDRANGRSGSNILVHGGCSSVGCFAMTDAVNAEIYDLVSAALRNGAASVPLHVFPFRMTEANLAATPAGRWTGFWSDLKLGYDAFERTRLPPNISVCGKRYRVRDYSPFGPNADRIQMCEGDRDGVPDHLDPDAATEQQNASQQAAPPPPPPCAIERASCRKWLALHERRIASRTLATQTTGTGKRPRIR